MVFDKVIDWVNIAQTTAPNGTTITYRIKLERRRLEGFVVEVTGNYSALTTPTSDGLLNVVKEIRLRVNDVLGWRNVVQIRGPQLLSFLRNNGMNLHRGTQNCIGRTATGAFTVQYLVPLRHPQIAEPFGNFLSIPLDRLNDEPTLEIDIGNTEIAATATASGTFYVNFMPILREVDPKWLYIPSELRTDVYQWQNAASKQTWEMPGAGWVTSILMSHYSSSVNTRGAVIGSAQYQWVVEYGRNLKMRFTDSLIEGLNDQTQLTYPSGLTVATDVSSRNFGNEAYLDFLSDWTDNDSFSVGSVQNLNSLAAAGDKLRITGNDLAAGSNQYTRFTYHKLLPQSAKDLSALTANI